MGADVWGAVAQGGSGSRADGIITAREKGTPQGGVLSPRLANLYLHHSFDCWMEQTHPLRPFERYADDIVIHCHSLEAAEGLQEFKLELHPEKTRIVYCKNYQRPDRHENESFTFLGYSFQPRTARDKFGRTKRIVMFGAAIGSQAKKGIRVNLRETLPTRWSDKPLEWFAHKLNPKIRGWVNYYTRFNRRVALGVFYYLNELIRQWIKNTYKIRGKAWLYDKYRAIQSVNPGLFYHGQLAIKA
jgi:RNA-directed DNA polymerase